MESQFINKGEKEELDFQEKKMATDKIAITITNRFKPSLIGLVNPVKMIEGLDHLNLYKVPSLVPPMEPKKLLEKHAKFLEYEGSYRDGYIFRMNVLAAETIEQQNLLRVAINDTVPYDEKPKALQEVWDNMVVKRRPTYMFATVKYAADVHMATFAPIWQVIDQTDNGFVIRVGGKKEDLGLDKDVPYVEFEAKHLDKSTFDFAYDMFYKLRTEDEEVFNKLVEKGAENVPLSPYSIYLANLLKFGESGTDDEGDESSKAKHLFYPGEDDFILSRTDPHEGYLMTIHKKIDYEGTNEDEELKFDLKRFNLYFKMNDVNRAIRAADYIRKQMKIRCLPVPKYPSDKDKSVVTAMMNHYRASKMNRYTCAKIHVEKKETVANIYEFIGKDSYVSVLVPLGEESKVFGFVFDSDAKSLIERLVPEELREASLVPNIQIDNERVKIKRNPSLPENPARIGEIQFSAEKKAGIVFKRDGKDLSEKRRFTTIDFIDNEGTIAAMAMEFIK